MKKIYFLSFLIINWSPFAKAQQATCTVNINNVVNPNTKLLLGITFDCRAGMTGTSGPVGYFQNDSTGTLLSSIAPLFSDFPISTVRYPANGVMLGFDWRKAIGLVATRPNQNLLGSLGAAQPMKFGFDEFITMVTNKGVQGKDIQIMVPIYDASTIGLTLTQQAGAIANVASFDADWVEYCNAPNNGTNPRGGTDWAAVRAANGHPNPYNIKIWNIGNEPWAPKVTNGTTVTGEFGLTAADCNAYLNYVTPLIDSMLASDPTIKITLPTNGSPSSTNSWNYTILNSTLVAQGKIYGLSQHAFQTEFVNNGSIQGIASVETLLKSLTTAAATKNVKVFLGDYAHGIRNTNNKLCQDSAMQWLGTNLAVDMLLMNSQLSNFERTNFWTYGLPYAQWHPIRINTDASHTLMPVAAMYKKMYSFFLDKSLQSTNTSIASTDGVNYAVRASTFAKNDLSKVNIIAVNRDKLSTIAFKPNGLLGYTQQKATLFSANALDSDVFSETSITADALGNFLIPAMGIAVLEYTLSTMPLRFIEFKAAYRNENYITSSWQTANEINVSHFNIQRSTNGKDFETVGKVDAKNNGEYSFTDKLPTNAVLPPTFYYRIEAINKDGKHSYSEVRQISIINAPSSIKIYPNPVSNGNLNIDFGEEIKAKTNYIITTAEGRIVQQGIITNQQETISIQNLNKGIYIIKLANKQKQFVVL